MRATCVCGLLLLVPAMGIGGETERLVAVTGVGTATSAPDMATIQTGVVTEVPTASGAMDENKTAAARLLETLKKNQIAARDVQTSTLNVMPMYETDQRGRTRPRITGYRVTNSLHVRVRHLPSLGAVLDALIQAGSNEMSGISFGIDDPTGVMNSARNRAMADAKSRAELYAQAAGMGVGRVLQIREEQASLPRPMYQGAARAMDVIAVPVATGEQEISATINVVYELTDR